MIVLVLIELEKEYQQRLEAIAREAVFIYDNAKTVKLDVIQSATVILGNPLPDMLAQASHLKWIQTESAGVDKYVLEDVLPEGVILTNATGAYGTIVAEHMLALLLTLCKKIHLSRDLQKQGIWKKCGEMRYVSNSTILVVGLGDIGGAFAKMVKSLGAYVIGTGARI
ncbi:MAG: NAD(P)-dependent oxidoreductase [Turicibacter sp.]|nr:NAD(P)-dependent oxidoreductase [Turicibacter sp.]